MIVDERVPPPSPWTQSAPGPRVSSAVVWSASRAARRPTSAVTSPSAANASPAAANPACDAPMRGQRGSSTSRFVSRWRPRSSRSTRGASPAVLRRDERGARVREQQVERVVRARRLARDALGRLVGAAVGEEVEAQLAARAQGEVARVADLAVQHPGHEPGLVQAEPRAARGDVASAERAGRVDAQQLRWQGGAGVRLVTVRGHDQWMIVEAADVDGERAHGRGC
jgi:hypothetical protein